MKIQLHYPDAAPRRCRLSFSFVSRVCAIVLPSAMLVPLRTDAAEDILRTSFARLAEVIADGSGAMHAGEIDHKNADEQVGSLDSKFDKEESRLAALKKDLETSRAAINPALARFNALTATQPQRVAEAHAAVIACQNFEKDFPNQLVLKARVKLAREWIAGQRTSPAPGVSRDQLDAQAGGLDNAAAALDSAPSVTASLGSIRSLETWFATTLPAKADDVRKTAQALAERVAAVEGESNGQAARLQVMRQSHVGLRAAVEAQHAKWRAAASVQLTLQLAVLKRRLNPATAGFDGEFEKYVFGGGQGGPLSDSYQVPKAEIHYGDPSPMPNPYFQEPRIEGLEPITSLEQVAQLRRTIHLVVQAAKFCEQQRALLDPDNVELQVRDVERELDSIRKKMDSIFEDLKNARPSLEAIAPEIVALGATIRKLDEANNRLTVANQRLQQALAALPPQ